MCQERQEGREREEVNIQIPPNTNVKKIKKIKKQKQPVAVRMYSMISEVSACATSVMGSLMVGALGYCLSMID